MQIRTEFQPVKVRLGVPRATTAPVLVGGSRPGPECDLVLEFMAGNFFAASDPLTVTLFREPKIGSGRPDLVAVIWDRAVAESRPSGYCRLGLAEFRLAQSLARGAPAAGVTSTRAESRSVELLASAGIVDLRRNRIELRPLECVLAVRAVVAIEAKMALTSEVIFQAALNRWFASESYALVPSRRPMTRGLDMARRLGVGVWSLAEGEVSEKLSAIPVEFPGSYVVWLFNESVSVLARECPPSNPLDSILTG